MESHYKLTTEVHPAERSITLLLNGKFSEDALMEVQQSILKARGARQKVLIDLSEVTLVDRKAVEYIAEHVGSDLKVVNCPIYLRHWIRQVGDDNGH
jgi:ABC-type transporter Mla MlaB component